MTHSDDPSTPRSAPGDGSAAPRPEGAPGDGAPTSKSEGAPASFRYDGPFVRLVSPPPVAAGSAASSPAPIPAPESAPSGPPAPPPSASVHEPGPPPVPNPDAELAASMARVQQRLDRVGERRPAATGRPAESLAPAELDARRRRFEPWIVAGIALLACVLMVAGYLAAVVPGPWLTDEAPRRFSVADIQLVRGSGQRTPNELVVQAPGEGGIAILSLTTDLRADRFRGLAWERLWACPTRSRSGCCGAPKPIRDACSRCRQIIEAGQLRPVLVASAAGWMGRIRGLGLSVAGPLPQPLRVRGVAAKPMGAGELLADRAREWFAFERWSGTPINVLVRQRRRRRSCRFPSPSAPWPPW